MLVLQIPVRAVAPLFDHERDPFALGKARKIDTAHNIEAHGHGVHFDTSFKRAVSNGQKIALIPDRPDDACCFSDGVFLIAHAEFAMAHIVMIERTHWRLGSVAFGFDFGEAEHRRTAGLDFGLDRLGQFLVFFISGLCQIALTFDTRFVVEQGDQFTA